MTYETRTPEQQREIDALTAMMEDTDPAPPMSGNPDLMGMKTPSGLFVCHGCCGRLFARGHAVPTGSKPVWQDMPVPTCCLCMWPEN